MDILVFVLFSILNGKLAKKKGLRQGPWIWRTIGAMFAGAFLGSMIISAGYKGSIDVASMQKFLSDNPLKVITMYMLEIGGGLLVRYILEKKPDATSQE